MPIRCGISRLRPFATGRQARAPGVGELDVGELAAVFMLAAVRDEAPSRDRAIDASQCFHSSVHPRGATDERTTARVAAIVAAAARAAAAMKCA